ncbi:MAG: signal peptidase I [Oscillospiraceae bacterium]
MNRTAKRIWNSITTIIAVAFVAVAILLSGVKMVGLTPLCVLSGSMEPTYKTGSMIYVKKTEAEKIKVNDAITFYMDDGKTLATHRVIKVDTKNKQFYTKGDANSFADPKAVEFDRAIGKPVFTIPYLGYVASFVTSHVGKFISILVAGLLILSFFGPDFINREKENKNKLQDKQQAVK